MNDQKQQLLKWVRWVLYPFIALVILEALLFDGSESGYQLRMLVDKVIIFGLLAFFSVMLLAFFLHFLGTLRRPHASHGIGSVQIALRHSPWLLRGILVAVLLINVVSLLFIPDLRAAWTEDYGIASAWSDLDLQFQAMIVFFSAIALFLVLVFLQRAVLNPPWFLLTRDGFLYEPGGMSPGLIRWSDVRNMKEDAVLAGTNAVSGPRLDPVLVITLRDYDKYLSAYNPLLRFLVRQLTRVLRFQTGGGDIYLNPRHFGARYAEVKSAMHAQWREAVPERE